MVDKTATIRIGNLLDSDTKYIAHQCNCITQNAAGTALSIFTKFPYSNIYHNRESGQVDSAGKIVISGDGDKQRFVINMLAQVYTGKPRYPLNGFDGTVARQRYFFKCLKKISKIDDLTSIAFPFKIGCNLGGGNWDIYQGYLDKFASHMKDKAEVFIYKLPD